MDVLLAVAVTLAGRKVEVANDFVDADAPFDAASFFSLLVQVLAVVLALALLYVLASAERP